MADKTYINGASIKEVEGQYGSFFNMSFNLEKLAEYSNDKGYINMTVSKRREPGQYGETHYAVLNEYSPDNVQNNSTTSTVKHNDEDISVEDIPF